jgi:leucyl-tRNA synthetase
VMADERSVKYVADKTVRKVIVVSQRIVNVVLS